MVSNEEVEKARSERIAVFCPIIRERCRTDCECYYEGNLDNADTHQKPTLPSCTHAMVSGEITIYNS